MRNSMQYIVDNQGTKTSVIVPFHKWEKINSDYKKLQNKLKVFLAVQDGLVELKTAKREGKKLQTLSDFLNESNS
jgi:methionyl-tRNA formyltransferase